MATPGRSAPALFSAGTVRRWARNGFLAGFLLGCAAAAAALLLVG